LFIGFGLKQKAPLSLGELLELLLTSFNSILFLFLFFFCELCKIIIPEKSRLVNVLGSFSHQRRKINKKKFKD
jgi:hypothetical protein